MQHVLAFLSARPVAGHVLAFVSGLLLPLSFAPFHFWPVAIASLLALRFCVEDDSRLLLNLYLYYLGAFLVGTSWIYVSINVYGGASPLLAGLLVILFVAGWSLTSIPHALAWRYAKRHGLAFLPLVFAILWALSEWFRTWLLTGFPWLFLGYGFQDTPLVGFAPVAGVYAVSLTVVLTVTLLFDALARRTWIPLPGVLGAWLLGGLLWQVSFVEESHRVDVVAVQGNIDQHTKWQREQVVPIYETYTGLTETHWDADLIVWPEAALTVFRENGDLLLAPLAKRARESDTTLVLGIPDRDDDGRFLNTTIALGEGAGQYHKRRLVPFGEYVPLEGLLRGTIAFFDLPMSRNSPGEWQQAPMTAGGLRLSMSICYEIVYPALVRNAVAAPDLLLTVSNDTWFGRSIGPDQHLQMALMRAIENGRALVRSTNNGLTVLADERGQVLASLPSDVPDVLRGEVPVLTGETPYHRLGNWPVLAFSFAVLMVAIARRQTGSGH